MASSAKLCRYLHVPLQSGDNEILRAMGRHYSAEQYRDFAAYALRQVPLLGLGADVLVGFPGEDERRYQNTLTMIRDLPFSNLHIFPYSRRPGTRAAAMPGQVPASLKRERCAKLAAMGRQKRAAYAGEFVGRNVSVLVERVNSHGLAVGWTGERIEARLRRAAAVNEIVSFVPDRSEAGILYG